MSYHIRTATFAALTFAISAQGALASEVRRIKSDKATTVTHQSKSNRYCIRLSSTREAERLTLPLHRSKCNTVAKWAREGVTLWHGGIQIAARD